MTVKDKIKYLNDIDNKKDSKIYINQPGKTGSGFKRLFYFVSYTHALKSIIIEPFRGLDNILIQQK
jgi:hypothetical protein